MCCNQAPGLQAVKSDRKRKSPNAKVDIINRIYIYIYISVHVTMRTIHRWQQSIQSNQLKYHYCIEHTMHRFIPSKRFLTLFCALSTSFGDVRIKRTTRQTLDVKSGCLPLIAFFCSVQTSSEVTFILLCFYFITLTPAYLLSVDYAMHSRPLLYDRAL